MAGKEKQQEREKENPLVGEKHAKGSLYEDAIRAWSHAAAAATAAGASRRGWVSPVPASAVPAAGERTMLSGGRTTPRGSRTPRILPLGKEHKSSTVPGLRGHGWAAQEYSNRDGDEVGQAVGGSGGVGKMTGNRGVQQSGGGSARRKRRVFSWREWSGVGW